MFRNFRFSFKKCNYSTKTSIKASTKKSKWKSVVGLEIHAQISSESKLFSGAGTDFGKPTNSQVSLFDASTPGTLPVLNKKCVELGVKTALALSCQLNAISMFDRKHYFYADLPAGYQITQQRAPLAINGSITFPVFVPGVTKKPYYKTARLHQLQLEQDSGKSLHDTYEGKSLVDLNRAGTPLMELVFEPDLTDGEEAAAMVKELVLILTRLNSCSCRMEEGALRVDANISIHEEGTPYGTRTEVKNIGSIRAVANAIQYEIKRQIEVLDNGGVIHNETRNWDARTKTTISMRDKEVVQDYRFMPEPNLPPLHLNMTDFSDNSNTVNVVEIERSLPEMPEQVRCGLIEQHKVSQEIAIILVNEDILFGYFQDIALADSKRSPKIVANFLINDLLKICNKNKIELEELKISSKNLGNLIDMVQDGRSNLHLAKLILQEMLTTDKCPMEIADKNNLWQISDEKTLKELCQNVIDRNPKMVEQYRKGKSKVFYAMVGEIAKSTEQRANMEKTVNLLKKMLD